MSLSTSGALKALIESAGLGLTADRDERSRSNTAANWVTISENISAVPASVNTPRDPLGPRVVSELAQVDLWQTWRDPSTRNVVESPALARSLHHAIDGARLPTSPTRTWSVLVRSSRRMPPEQEANLIHTAFTVQLIRTA
jgi:hypothetical protein